MKKSELRTGDEIVRRDGNVGTVLLDARGCGDIIRMTTTGTWIGVSGYNNDLTVDDFDELDIMKVYQANAWGGRKKLLWKREEVLEVTMEDICEKYGTTVKIVKNKK